jgi:hypothetical protein
MPTYVKLLGSLVMLAISGLAALYEHSKGLQWPTLITIAFGVFLVFSIWVFPDVNREK